MGFMGCEYEEGVEVRPNGTASHWNGRINWVLKVDVLVSAG
jgi:hypothetical protein